MSTGRPNPDWKMPIENPLEGRARTTANGGLQVYRWDDGRRSWAPTMRGRKWPGEFGTHREGLAVDDLDPPGVYLGTTTGDLFFSPDGARTWSLVPYRFPAIHSVSVASPRPLSESLPRHGAMPAPASP